MDDVNTKLSIRKVPFQKAKDAINAIYHKNFFLGPYQSYEFLDITGKGFVDKHPFATLFLQDVTYIEYRGNEPVAVLPLLVNSKGKKAYFRGEFTSAGILDAIYLDNWTYEEYVELLSVIKQEVCEFLFSRIPEKSLFFLFSQKYWNLQDSIKRGVCVSIPIPDSYDEWYKSLSKSVRQNYRTAINRLRRKGYSFYVKHYWSNSMSQDQYIKVQWLYCKRLAEHYTGNGILVSLLRMILFIIKYRNPMSLSFLRVSSSFRNELFINNELAAVCWGFVCQYGDLIVPRFFINSKYSKYSPGGILISEIVKELRSTTLPGLMFGGGRRLLT